MLTSVALCQTATPINQKSWHNCDEGTESLRTVISSATSKSDIFVQIRRSDGEPSIFSQDFWIKGDHQLKERKVKKVIFRFDKHNQLVGLEFWDKQ